MPAEGTRPAAAARVTELRTGAAGSVRLREGRVPRLVLHGEIDAAIIDQVNFPKFPTEDDGQALRDYGAAVVQYGIIDEEPADYDALFAVKD